MKYKYRDQPCGRTVYHWHEDCVLVPDDVRERAGWIVTDRAPADRARCGVCSDLERTAAPTLAREKLRPTASGAPGAVRRDSSL